MTPTESVLLTTPLHPGVQGPLQVRLDLDGDTVLAGEPRIGFMHRGVEKLAEVRDYRALLPLANRHEWLSAFPGELGVALLVEDALGIHVPVRATWIRTLLAEVSRVLTHMTFLGLVADAAGHPRALERAFAAREPLQGLLEEATGGRLHVMYARIGGVAADLPPSWLARARTVLAAATSDVDALAGFIASRSVRGRLRGLGVVDPRLVPGYGLSGPVARACGAHEDLRLDAPALAYAEIFTAEHVVTRTDGDALARCEVLADEARVSLALTLACLDRLDTLRGDISERLPKVIRLPEGEYHLETENPLGVAGYYVASRGEKTPWRFSMRTPSFATLSAVHEVLPGTHVDDIGPLLASMLYVTGDADR